MALIVKMHKKAQQSSFQMYISKHYFASIWSLSLRSRKEHPTEFTYHTNNVVKMYYCTESCPPLSDAIKEIHNMRMVEKEV
jgi:hypothetical protein